MRYLAILLLAPWLLILGWLYWAYPKSLPRTGARRGFDGLILLLAAGAAVGSALLGFDGVQVPQVGQFGPQSGAIWRQVLPALYGYGACVGVLVLGAVLRLALWRRRSLR
ncbi:hypothetical protein [Dyella sp.]|uniref:hypothetical protein n=1 Tax=Dyella sp. TaxID=1869338 RepID=UPI002ED209F6